MNIRSKENFLVSVFCLIIRILASLALALIYCKIFGVTGITVLQATLLNFTLYTIVAIF